MITDKVGGSSAKPEVSKQSKEKRLKHKVSGYKSQSKRRLIAGCSLQLRTLYKMAYKISRLTKLMMTNKYNIQVCWYAHSDQSPVAEAFVLVAGPFK